MTNTPSQDDMPAWGHPIRLRGKTQSQDFNLAPNADARKALAEDLGISGIRKLTFSGTISPASSKDWYLKARLGSTVVQPCVVTLEPVTTRIDIDVSRQFLAETPDLPEAAELEMPEDDTIEPLTDIVDIGVVMAEALAIALPDWPRAPGVELGESVFTRPGQAPMTDDDARPFAGLESLKKTLEKKGEDDV